MSGSFDEPTIPPRLQRPLAAVWISLGVHAALIALVQVAPPATLAIGEPAIEARLAPVEAAAPVTEAAAAPPAEAAELPVDKAPVLASSETVDALPAEPSAAPPAPPHAELPAPAEPAPAPLAEVAPAPPPVATITSSVDLTYYTARDVDEHPHAVREIVPDYPAAADQRRLSGRVRLQLKLEADGRVSDIDVQDASPPGMFEDSAVKAFRDARFVPARRNGRPVRALVLIEVKYDWEGRPR